MSIIEEYNRELYEVNALAHKGKKGMKWGYNDGKENGKRKAGEDMTDEEFTEMLGKSAFEEYNKAESDYKKAQKDADEAKDWDTYADASARKDDAASRSWFASSKVMETPLFKIMDKFDSAFKFIKRFF